MKRNRKLAKSRKIDTPSRNLIEAFENRIFLTAAWTAVVNHQFNYSTGTAEVPQLQNGERVRLQFELLVPAHVLGEEAVVFDGHTFLIWNDSEIVADTNGHDSTLTDTEITFNAAVTTFHVYQYGGQGGPGNPLIATVTAQILYVEDEEFSSSSDVLQPLTFPIAITVSVQSPADAAIPSINRTGDGGIDVHYSIDPVPFPSGMSANIQVDYGTGEPLGPLVSIDLQQTIGDGVAHILRRHGPRMVLGRLKCRQMGDAQARGAKDERFGGPTCERFLPRPPNHYHRPVIH